jgi:zinc protease
MSPVERAPELSADLPRPGPVPPLRVGRPSRSTLANGLEAMVVARASVPRVELRLTVPAGAAIGPSAAASELLRAGILLGTKRLNQEEVSESIQRLGGSLTVRQDQDRLQIAASALSEAEDDLYRLIFALVEQPAFPGDELETERVKLIEGLRTARATPEFPAAEQLQRIVYGNHPYGRPEPLEAAIHKTTRRQLQALHRATFVPSAGQITVVGDVVPRRTLARLRNAFGTWSGPRRRLKVPRVRPHLRPEVTFIDRPGSVQTVILAGASVPPPGHPDHIPLTLASAVLGGSFSSRLMSNLREDKGYTYGASSTLDGHLKDSLLGVEIEVRTEVTAPSQVELTYELGRLASVEVTQDELEATRNYLAGVRVIVLQTQSGLASSLAQVRGLGLDHRYLESYSDRLAAVSPAELRRVAARYLAPAQLSTVMVGDAAKVAGSVSSLGRIRILAPKRDSQT